MAFHNYLASMNVVFSRVEIITSVPIAEVALKLLSDCLYVSIVIANLFLSKASLHLWYDLDSIPEQIKVLYNFVITVANSTYEILIWPINDITASSSQIEVIVTTIVLVRVVMPEGLRE